MRAESLTMNITPRSTGRLFASTGVRSLLLSALTALAAGCASSGAPEVSDFEIANLKIKYDAFHPDWNYTIVPR